MSEEKTGFASLVYNFEAEALVRCSDLHNPGHRYKYAAIMRGHDEHGRPRAVALRWDGAFEVLSPTTGAVLKPAVSFEHGELARREDGKVVRRAGGGLLLSSPPSTSWVAMAEDGGRGVFIDADEMLEVVPSPGA